MSFTAFFGFASKNAIAALSHHRRALSKQSPKMALGLSLGLLWGKNGVAGYDVGDGMALPLTPVDQIRADSSMRSKFEVMLMKMQKELCTALQAIENQHEKSEDDEDGEYKFLVDRWEREDKKGGGITCIMEDGRVFERAGVNISVIGGSLPPAAVAQMRSRGRNLTTHPDESGLPFWVAGISCVIHPRNPNVPTIHFNFRYFEVEDWDPQVKQRKKTWWFGGGVDLTPYILFEEDGVLFHSVLKGACDKHGDKTLYPKYKKWCDEYFRITHRGESRGIGGLFFDDVDQGAQDSCYNFVKACADAVIPCYLPIVRRRKDTGYSYADREWQLIRRGRYVEFNLVHDRGTKFGLFTPGARFESILMSLPAVAKWKYCHTPPAGSKEDELLQILKNPRDWV